ncbi:MAG: hypothetical protein DMF61_06410 [Blastocatellia bacterium AA13]|nr:MAG: hypothetical protein DMF61_06410 [Blastocatellia bacterium AA13]
MDSCINIALISLGFLGAIIAFGGDTWRKTEGPLLKRITSRGWTSLVFLTLALVLGIWKEVRAKQSAATATEERNQLKTKLDDTRRALLSVEPSLLDGMYKLTARITREFDFAFLQLRGQYIYTPISSETHSALKLYGGDEFEYTFMCGSRGYIEPTGGDSVSLEAGNRDYTLTGAHGIIRVAGPIGQAMDIRIKNAQRVTDCDIKIVIRSTDRTRVETTFAPILKAIEEAKQAKKTETYNPIYQEP